MIACTLQHAVMMIIYCDVATMFKTTKIGKWLSGKLKFILKIQSKREGYLSQFRKVDFVINNT